MKKYLNHLSWGSVAFIALIMTLWACKKESVTNSNSSNASASIKVTHETLSNDVYFQDYIKMFNEMQAKLTFLDRSRSIEERKSIKEELFRLTQILRQKDDDSFLKEREMLSELLGFSSMSEMKSFYKELNKKREEVLLRFPLLREKNSSSNQVLLKEAYSFSQRYLMWMVVHTKEEGTYVLNKIAWRNSLNTLSTIELRCCPTGWDNICNSNPCQKDAIESLQSTYGGCNAQYLEQTTSGDTGFAASDYAMCTGSADSEYDNDVAKCE
jgi:hypothetical protein